MVDDKWRKKREIVFPGIKNWSDPQNELRFKHPKKMDMYEWIFMSPDLYKLVVVGGPIIASLMFGGVAWYFVAKTAYIAAGFFALIATAFGYVAVLQKLKLRLTPDMNLYDIFMREYIPEDVGDEE